MLAKVKNIVTILTAVRYSGPGILATMLKTKREISWEDRISIEHLKKLSP